MSEGHTERLEAALDGKYRIERRLGEGGMATVYLAQDVKHERKVALKILKPELAAVIGAERFLSEIKTTANLQHPHILPLFDSGNAGGYLYYVMPYIDGETLRDKLDREKQLGVEESVRIARDVADALDYAHRHGVIHRDIKPANILLHDGRPVVSDFGIALAVSSAGGGRMTETGLSLGTPHYMSPEQASADRDISARSDVYSLGCVLYEMIGGQPPHTGPSAQSILVHILTKEATPLTELRRTVPPHVAAAVAKSIEKLPADRFETAKAFKDAIDDTSFAHEAGPRTATLTPGTGYAPARRGPALPWQRDRRVVGALAGGAVMAVLAALSWLRPAPEPPPTEPVRFTFPTRLDFQGDERELAISPNGRVVVYKVTGATGTFTGPVLEMRALGELAGATVRGSEGAVGPFVSPDGQWVGFTRFENRTTLQRVSILGGAPVTLTESPTQIVGASWGTDGQIIFGTRAGTLFRVSEGGGEPEPLTTLADGATDHLWPSIIEGRGAVVFTINPTGAPPRDVGQLAVLDLESGDVTRLGIQGFSPRYVSTGHLVYAAGDGSVRAVPFDVEALTVTGNVVPLLEGVSVKAGGAADFDISTDGRLVYNSGGGDGGFTRTLVWVDRTGREEALGAPVRGYTYPRISPDGRRVALDIRGDGGGIWIWDFSASTLTRMILGEGSFSYPVWNPDGSRIAYGDNIDILWKLANTGTPEVLLAHPGGEGTGSGGGRAPTPYFFTPDGSALVFRDQNHPETRDDLVMMSVGGDGSPLWRLAGPFIERNAELSPDGRWMAYQSDESGAFQIYVRPFPGVVEGNQVQVSNAGGTLPLWSRDGAELFYLQTSAARTELVSVAVRSGGADQAFAFGERNVILDWPYFGLLGRSYDVSPDGERFLAIRAGDAAANANATVDITVVLNWFTELRERMGN